MVMKGGSRNAGKKLANRAQHERVPLRVEMQLGLVDARAARKAKKPTKAKGGKKKAKRGKKRR